MNPIQVPRFSSQNGFETNPQRSRIMAKIKGKDTKPELILRKALWKAGLRYRINNKKILGQPDLFISKYNLVIFVDGDFWHGYKWEIKKPKIMSNREYWIARIERNMQRDLEITQRLKESGYSVLRFWEHEVKENREDCTKKIYNLIPDKVKFQQIPLL